MAGKKKAKPENNELIIDQMKAVFGGSKESHYAISKAAGVDQATISKFLSGGRGMNVASFAKLCNHFGLELAYKSA